MVQPRDRIKGPYMQKQHNPEKEERPYIFDDPKER